MDIALIGNPNTGKSTLFNGITGARQKVGNWPGVTVEKKEGFAQHNNCDLFIVDLPGTYSINARSIEEKVVVEYLRSAKLDLAVNVLDSTNLERNLFLTVQLLEWGGIPLLLDFNIEDEADKRGIEIDISKIEELIGIPAIKTCGRNRESRKKLLDKITSLNMSEYGHSKLVQEHIDRVHALRKNIKSEHDLEEAIIEARYEFIDKIIAQAVRFVVKGKSTSEKLDSVLANGLKSIPIFFLILYGVFQITFSWIGQPITDSLNDFISGPFTAWAGDSLKSLEVAPWLYALITDGVIAGVGAVLSFVPLIMVLFFCLSILDGSGYMARIAFIMDPLMRKCGLTGKGIMPLMLGFGCGVPAIMSARALDSYKDRMIAMLVTPFLTCGAKLPVMALFALMFFPDNAANVVFVMYVVGAVVAILMSRVLGATVLRGTDSTFLLELPPYRVPEAKLVLWETWDKGKGYIIKTGTVIFAASVLIWFLSNYNFDGMCEMDASFLAILGGWFSHLFAFHGLATWEAGASLLSGAFAKESIISTLGILYNASDAALDAETLMMNGLGSAFTAMSALAFMVFAQLYIPCATVLATIKKESGSWKWVAFSACYMFVVAWLVSLLVYQIGMLFCA